MPPRRPMQQASLLEGFALAVPPGRAGAVADRPPPAREQRGLFATAGRCPASGASVAVSRTQRIVACACGQPFAVTPPERAAGRAVLPAHEGG